MESGERVRDGVRDGVRVRDIFRDGDKGEGMGVKNEGQGGVWRIGIDTR